MTAEVYIHTKLRFTPGQRYPRSFPPAHGGLLGAGTSSRSGASERANPRAGCSQRIQAVLVPAEWIDVFWQRYTLPQQLQRDPSNQERDTTTVFDSLPPLANQLGSAHACTVPFEAGRIGPTAWVCLQAPKVLAQQFRSALTRNVRGASLSNSAAPLFQTSPAFSHTLFRVYAFVP